MNRYLLLLVLLIGCVVPRVEVAKPDSYLPPNTEYQPQTWIENDVFWGSQLPPFGKLCLSADVRGGPDATIYKVIETLPVGTIVELIELGRVDSSWVMIASARWIKLATVCKW